MLWLYTTPEPAFWLRVPTEGTELRPNINLKNMCPFPPFDHNITPSPQKIMVVDTCWFDEPQEQLIVMGWGSLLRANTLGIRPWCRFGWCRCGLLGEALVLLLMSPADNANHSRTSDGAACFWHLCNYHCSILCRLALIQGPLRKGPWVLGLPNAASVTANSIQVGRCQ